MCVFFYTTRDHKDYKYSHTNCVRMLFVLVTNLKKKKNHFNIFEHFQVGYCMYLVIFLFLTFYFIMSFQNKSVFSTYLLFDTRTSSENEIISRKTTTVISNTQNVRLTNMKIRYFYISDGKYSIKWLFQQFVFDNNRVRIIPIVYGCRMNNCSPYPCELRT